MRSNLTLLRDISPANYRLISSLLSRNYFITFFPKKHGGGVIVQVMKKHGYMNVGFFI